VCPQIYSEEYYICLLSHGRGVYAYGDAENLFHEILTNIHNFSSLKLQSVCALVRSEQYGGFYSYSVFKDSSITGLRLLNSIIIRPQTKNKLEISRKISIMIIIVFLFMETISLDKTT
jgi:hypothetical protein